MEVEAAVAEDVAVGDVEEEDRKLFALSVQVTGT